MKKLLIIITVFPFFTRAQLKLAKIFSDDMLLQRNQPVWIWGKAIPGKSVQVLFANEKRNTLVQSDSSWAVIFNKQKASIQPQSFSVISGDEKIVIKNILIGDLWLCIGQSNMEWPMQKEMHYKDALPNSRQPLMRLYNPTYAGKNSYNVLFTDSIIQNLFIMANGKPATAIHLKQ